MKLDLPEWLRLEHDVARILTEQELYGWAFDEPAAWQLVETLDGELQYLKEVLHKRYPFIPGEEFTPKRPNRTRGYVAGAPFTRLTETNFGSRDHIAFILQHHCKWKPTKLTPTGKPIIDEVVLRDINTPLSLQFLRLFELQKQLGMLYEGQNAWLKLVRNGRIHHRCSVSTDTGRCAHSRPNLAQVPSGDAFRRLFIAPPQRRLVGADLSGIELRMLAHYLGAYDGGRYASILLDGDIHQVNADKIGITRKQVKTVTYAFLYGAGDQKIGLSINPQLDPKNATSLGKKIRQAYMDAIPGLEKLVRAVKGAAESRGYVRAIDQRRILCDSGHKALNYLLQASAAVVAKRWMVIANTMPLPETNQLGFIHDELQFETSPAVAKDLCFKLCHAALEAGEYYKLRLPIEAEAKIGEDWSQTH